MLFIYLNLFERNFEYQLLQKAERTEKAANNPAENNSEQHNKAENIK